MEEVLKMWAKYREWLDRRTEVINCNGEKYTVVSGEAPTFANFMDYCLKAKLLTNKQKGTK